MRQHPKLIEVLRKHADERPELSRRAVEEYLQALASSSVKPITAVPAREPVVPQSVDTASNLRWLDLSDTQVTAEGVKKLREALPECEIAC